MRAQLKTSALVLLTLVFIALALSTGGCVAVRVSSSEPTPTPPASYYETPDPSASGSAGSTLGRVLASSTQASSKPDRTAQRDTNKQLALVRGEVVYVVDGDTAHIKLETGKIEKVRFIGVDTPESTIEHEPYGKEAAGYTRAELLHRTVYIEGDVSQRDHYGRLLAYVWMDRPSQREDRVSHADVARLMFNARLVGDGYAQMMTVPPNVKYVDDFRALERYARERNAGLWDPKIIESTQALAIPSGRASSTAIANPTKATGKVIGNCNSLKFHRPDCPAARKIATSHRLAFKNRSEARAAGYRPCKICRP